jgi:hypothetical protein
MQAALHDAVAHAEQRLSLFAFGELPALCTLRARGGDDELALLSQLHATLVPAMRNYLAHTADVHMSPRA